MSETPKRSRFTAVLDLTTRAQEQAKLQATTESLVEPQDALPGTDLASLPSSLQSAVASAGWPSLMPVQERAIPYLLEKRDLIVQSKTGSGKTGAFLLPLFELLDPNQRAVQALIMTPTRELARQIYEEFERLKGGREEVAGLNAALVYGGVGYGQQTKDLREGAPLVVGTPGRILDHLERRTFSLDKVRVLVLDEADEMLSMGFLPAMRKLRNYLPDRRQSYMFSATMPPAVRSLAQTFLNDPGFLAISSGNVSVDTLQHRYYVVEGMDKDRVLVRLIELENPESAIIFANTKREVEYLAKFLRNYGHDADELSGDLTQSAREGIMVRLREGKLRFLVATDVAARGIDISDLSHVFMYDVPQDPEYYVHRAGRTARAGKTGAALVLTTYEEKSRLLSIARRYNLPLEEYPIPTQEEVEARVTERLTELIESRVRNASNLNRERARRFEKLVRDLAQEEPLTLALLLDEIYHSSLHASPDPTILAAERVVPKPKREGDGGGESRGRRRKR